MSSDATDNTMRAERLALAEDVDLIFTLAGLPAHLQDVIRAYVKARVVIALRRARADTARQVAEAVAAEREACARCAETVPAWEAAKWIRKRADMFAAESQATPATGEKP